MSGCNQGAFSRLAIDGQEMEFVRFIPRGQYGLVDNSQQAIRGKLENQSARVTSGLSRFMYTVIMEPSPADLDVILPLVGMTETSPDVFSVEDGSGNSTSPSSFTMDVDYNVNILQVTGCKIGRYTLTGQRGDAPVRLALDIVGTDEATSGITWTASAIGTPDICYAFHESSMKLGTAVGNGADGIVEFDRFQLVIDNNLQVQFNNSQTATAICATRRDVTLSTTTPYTSTETALFTEDGPDGPDVSGYSSPDAYLKLARSDLNISTQYTFGNLKPILVAPEIKKEEIRLPLSFRSYSTSTAAALVVTHDATT